MSGDGHRFDLFRLVRSLFQHHGTFGFVGLGRSVTVMRRGSITEKAIRMVLAQKFKRKTYLSCWGGP